MIDLPLPTSKPLTSVSPTGFETLRLCRLRAAFGQQQQGPSPPRTPQQVLGDLCHAVLEDLVRSRVILQSDWRDAVDPLWLVIAERMAGLVHADPHEASLSGEPRTWPGYVIKRARLMKTVQRLHDLLASAGADAELISETPLATSDGRIQGRPDLIVRAPAESWVVDFKSGAVLDGDGQAPRDSYVRQLLLYALLEAAASGRWPSRAFLVPLNGPVVSVSVDEARAAKLGDEARQAVDGYNAVAPAPQPGAPSHEACGYCQWTTRCPAFWQAVDADWEESLLATAGVVTGTGHARLGGVTVALDAAAGSVRSGALVVRNISPQEHPAVMQVGIGGEIAIVGLRRLEHGNEFELPPWGQLAIWSPTP